MERREERGTCSHACALLYLCIGRPDAARSPRPAVCRPSPQPPPPSPNSSVSCTITQCSAVSTPPPISASASNADAALCNGYPLWPRHHFSAPFVVVSAYCSSRKTRTRHDSLGILRSRYSYIYIYIYTYTPILMPITTLLVIGVHVQLLR